MALDPGQKSVIGTVSQVVGLLVVLGSAFHWSGRIALSMDALQDAQQVVTANQQENAKAIASVVQSVDRLAFRVERAERDIAAHGERLDKYEDRR